MVELPGEQECPVKNARIVKEVPRGFKGVWIPRSLWLNPHLTPKQIILLAEVDSLDCDGKGCYASNDYLGQFLGTTGHRVANMLVDLRKKGLIRTVSFDGRQRRIKAIFPKEVKADFPETGIADIPESGNADVSESGKYRYKEREKKSVVAGAKSSGRRREIDPLFSHGKSKKSGFSYDCAKKLYDALAAKRKIDRRANLDNWASSFRKLRQDHTKEEIEQVLAWYINNIGKPYVPEAHSANSFHEKFQRISEAIRRNKRDESKELRQQMREGTEDIQWPITWTDERGWKCEMFSDGSWGCTSPTDRKGRSTAQPHMPGDTYGLPEHLKPYTLAAAAQQDVPEEEEGDIE